MENTINLTDCFFTEEFSIQGASFVLPRISNLSLFQQAPGRLESRKRARTEHTIFRIWFRMRHDRVGRGASRGFFAPLEEAELFISVGPFRAY